MTIIGHAPIIEALLHRLAGFPVAGAGPDGTPDPRRRPHRLAQALPAREIVEAIKDSRE